MARDPYPREKNWKQLYSRSNKLHRAEQLGFVYPRLSERQLMDSECLRVLFVCSMNRWRSPTAEKVYRDHSLVQCRSRGTSRKAVRPVVQNDLHWADVICVMETKHRQQLQSQFSAAMQHRELHVLEIPDDYRFMDPELVELIRLTVDPILMQHRAPE